MENIKQSWQGGRTGAARCKLKAIKEDCTGQRWGCKEGEARLSPEGPSRAAQRTRRRRNSQGGGGKAGQCDVFKAKWRKHFKRRKSVRLRSVLAKSRGREVWNWFSYMRSCATLAGVFKFSWTCTGSRESEQEEMIWGQKAETTAWEVLLRRHGKGDIPGKGCGTENSSL